jgi:sec-independent protein translocase protein TatB
MFDVGFSEVLLIALVGLLVFGPERLPSLIKEVTFWIRKIRGVIVAARSEIEGELRVIELRDTLQEKRHKAEKEIAAIGIKRPGELLPRPPGLPSRGFTDSSPNEFIQTGSSVRIIEDSRNTG